MDDAKDRSQAASVAWASRAEVRAWAAARGLSPADLAELEAVIGPLPEPDGGASPTPGLLAGRYEDLGLLGRGGMGEVRRVHDHVLQRVVAMKILRPELLGTPAAVARFIDEAHATAALQHPSIVPVHDLGRLPDGRVWFTCKAVVGQQFGVLIDALHAVSTDRWSSTPDGWSLRRLVGAFHAVCQAVGYAHERGVIHRDLKPANLLIGAHGEVYVVDWGIAKALGGPRGSGSAEGPVERALDSAYHTALGQVTGTPAYMPPEQAHGLLDQIDQRSDVYALGAVLYELLSGRPPYQGTAAAVLAQLRAGPPVPVGRVAEGSTFGWDPELQGGATGLLPLPEELVRVCDRAMCREPGGRYPSAVALGEAVMAWLDGSRRFEIATAYLSRARALEAEIADTRAEAAALQQQGEAALRAVPRYAPEEQKRAAWALLDEAERAREQADADDGEVDEVLRRAAQLCPEHADTRAFAAERALRAHLEAEAAGDERAARVRRRRLEVECAALPESDPRRGSLTTYLRGDGALTLVTDPPGAELLLYRYEEQHRRLTEVFVQSLGQTPVVSAPLPMGSYLVLIRHPACEEVRYPVFISRGHHWDGVRPGEAQATPVVLPPRGSVPAGMVYVPEGWAWTGADEPGATCHPRRRIWVHPILIDRFPLINVEFIKYLDALVAAGRVDVALEHAPHERGRGDGVGGGLCYGFDGQRFTLQADADGDLWLPDWPVTQISWDAARACMHWRGGQLGLPLRLPAELEWEKAARGVDGRLYPWGDHFDPSWCSMTDTVEGRNNVTPVGTFRSDQSVYGLRGAAGGQHDWCLDRFDVLSPRAGAALPLPVDDDPGDPQVLRVLRGGSWVSDRRYCRLYARVRTAQQIPFALVGMRGAALAPTDLWSSTHRSAGR